jgi:hypothetical protein
MPRVCSLCTHPDRPAVEADLAGGTPLRTVAARWGVSKTALLRHRENHRSPHASADWAEPPVATPAAAPHTLAAGVAALLAHCFPEMRAWFEDPAARLKWPLDSLVVAGLSGFVRHMEECPHRTAGPEE